MQQVVSQNLRLSPAALTVMIAKEICTDQLGPAATTLQASRRSKTPTTLT